LTKTILVAREACYSARTYIDQKVIVKILHRYKRNLFQINDGKNTTVSTKKY